MERHAERMKKVRRQWQRTLFNIPYFIFLSTFS